MRGCRSLLPGDTLPSLILSFFRHHWPGFLGRGVHGKDLPLPRPTRTIRGMAGAIVITVSDSRSRGAQADLSGPAVAKVLTDAGFAIAGTLVVPDEQREIEAALVEQSARAELVVTSGGTGIAARDVTPEAVLAVCDRILPGFGERMRSAGSAETPLSYLSRAMTGTRGSTLIVTLPGSPQGAVTSLRAVIELIPHALALLAGESTVHGGDDGGQAGKRNRS